MNMDNSGYNPAINQQLQFEYVSWAVLTDNSYNGAPWFAI